MNDAYTIMQPPRRKQRGFIIDPFRFGSSAPPPPTDPYFSNVVQLAHFDGTNGSTTFTNSCPRGDTLGPIGTGALSTAQFKWGTASLFSGNNGCSSTGHVDYKLSTNDYTLEFWVYLPSIAITAYLVAYQNSNGNVGIYFENPGKVHFYHYAERIVSANNVLVANTWQFVQYVRVYATPLGTLYVDGVSIGTWADNYDYSSIGGGELNIGYYPSYPSGGYFDDFRLTNGTARANAVPTAAFPDS